VTVPARRTSAPFTAVGWRQEPVAIDKGDLMATQHSPADDIVYNLVSIQYHALSAAQAYDSYVSDAEGHQDVQSFFKQCAQQDAERATKCHELLGRLTGGESGLSPSS